MITVWPGRTFCTRIGSVAMIAALAAFFLDRALVSMEAAERMAMETQARSISAALQLQMAALITRGRTRAIADLATRARTKKLLPDDVQGGTFTITNPGGFGTFHGTPIISQPQVGILGTYALVKRPWVVQDELGQDVIAIRPLMNITLTYDHRLVDGADAARFLVAMKTRLEDGSFDAELGL